MTDLREKPHRRADQPLVQTPESLLSADILAHTARSKNRRAASTS